MTATRRRTVVVTVTALVAAMLAAIQLRTGIVPMLDTVTYWSGVRATASGHPLTTTLAPSFSNFDLVEFLERGGRLPFVDFPVGYPLVGGLLAVAIGAEPAMVLLAVVASLVSAIALVIGTTRLTRWAPLAMRGVAAVALLALPAHRLVTQATLSEPLFAAVALALAVVLARHRRGEAPWWTVSMLVVAAGLLRFIGAPLAVLAGIEYFRRTRSIVRSAAWTVALMAPAALNIVWASASGGGHNAGWRGLGIDDVEVFVRSVGGWFDGTQGDLRLTYFGGVGPSWWSWPLTVAWVLGLVLAVIGSVVGAVDTGGRRARWRLPSSIELPWAMAAVVTTGLALGMLGFDALVIADNRLMLPGGILTLAGVLWWATERLDAAPSTGRTAPVAGLALVVWIVAAVRPATVGELFSDPAPERGDIAAVLRDGPAVVIANDADGVHWATEVPAAYAPLPVKALTGEEVDVEGVYASLPCPLSVAGGVVVLADEALFGSDGRAELDALVSTGRLTADPFPGGVLYRPGPSACP